MKNKEIKELLKNTNTIVLLTDNGTLIKGKKPDILTLYTLLTRELISEKFDGKKEVEKAFEVAHMNDKEIKEELKKSIDNVLSKLSRIMEAQK